MNRKLFLIYTIVTLCSALDITAAVRGGRPGGGRIQAVGNAGIRGAAMQRQSQIRPPSSPHPFAGQFKPTGAQRLPLSGQRPQLRPNFPKSGSVTGIQRPRPMPPHPNIPRAGVQVGISQRPINAPAANRLRQVQQRLDPNRPLRTDAARSPERLNQQKNFMRRRFDKRHDWYSLYRYDFARFIPLFTAAFYGAYGYNPPIASDYADLMGDMPPADPDFDAIAAGTMPLDFGDEQFPGAEPYYGPEGPEQFYGPDEFYGPEQQPYGPIPQFTPKPAAWVDYGAYPEDTPAESEEYGLAYALGKAGPRDRGPQQQGYYPPQEYEPEPITQPYRMQAPPESGKQKSSITIITPDKSARAPRLGQSADLSRQENLS